MKTIFSYEQNGARVNILITETEEQAELVKAAIRSAVSVEDNSGVEVHEIDEAVFARRLQREPRTKPITRYQCFKSDMEASRHMGYKWNAVTQARSRARPAKTFTICGVTFGRVRD